MPQNKKIIVQDLGIMSYKEAWDYQEVLCKKIIDIKLKNRHLAPDMQSPTPNYLLLCEHPHVYTLGKSGSEQHLLLQDEGLRENKIEFYKINRGGDITYHGPGQIVGYPILDLDNFFTDIHRYMRFLEEAILLTLADYGLSGGRIKGATGVWLDGDHPYKARKICAMGIRCTHWVTMHGWAFNVNTDLSYFNHIIPCGISDKSVTSLHKELNLPQVDVSLVKNKLLAHFATLFEAELFR